ncbi:hypothetical protein LSAT2_019714, partial [Lamellibrachia satsuma]
TTYDNYVRQHGSNEAVCGGFTMFPSKKDPSLYFVRLNAFERLRWSEFAERMTNSQYGDETVHEIITLMTQTTNYLGREKTDIMGKTY